MTQGASNGHPNGSALPHVRTLPLFYDSEDSQQSATSLILTVRPDWASDDSNIEFVRFTDGITNTLLKAINKRKGWSKEDIGREAILLRAYGNGTAVLIDREREAQNHELLMKHGLAPELLARFQNGMLYRFIKGSVTAPEDLRKPNIYRAVASRLAQWHATVPCITHQTSTNGNAKGHDQDLNAIIENAAPGKPVPNLWSVMQKWILALPSDTQVQRERQDKLQKEFEYIVEEFSQRPGLGVDGVSHIEPPGFSIVANGYLVTASICPLRFVERQRDRVTEYPARQRPQEGSHSDVHRLRICHAVTSRFRYRQSLGRVGWIRLRLQLHAYPVPASRVH